MMEHGGRLDDAIKSYGGTRADWLDLSTGISPFSYPVPSIPEDVLARLPDKQLHADLLKAARSYYGVPEGSEIVVGNGSQNFIQIIPELFEQSTVAILAPTYNEHASSWERSGHKVVSIDSGELPETAFHAVIVNPNNPDGNILGRDDLQFLASQCAKKGGQLVVDEAFCDDVPELSIIPEIPDNCVVLKSVGKFFGLAGIRLGFAICGSETAETLCNKLGPWPVSGPSQLIGTTALSDLHWIDQQRQRHCTLSNRLVTLLATHGLEIIGATALFVFGAHAKASKISQSLLRDQILVRTFKANEDWLRFGLPRDEAAFERLAAALTTALKE